MNKPITNALTVTTAAKKLLLTGVCFFAAATLAGIGTFAVHTGLAQSQESPKPSFDAASVKPSDCGLPGIQGVVRSMGLQPGRFTGCSSLKGFISAAYQVEDKDPEISGGPGWIDSDNFMIEAKAEGVTDRGTLRLMMRSLLEERFGLRLHCETKEQPVYSLVIAKGSHKLKESRDENGNLIDYLPQPGEKMKNVPKQNSPDGWPSKFPGSITMRPNANTGQMEIIAYDVTLQKFADKILRRLTGRNVVDKTGLNGYYSIELHTALDPNSGIMQPEPSNRTDRIPSVELSGPSIFAAVQDQLGLKLEAGRAPLEVLVIDSAEKPSEN
jgi:uncharacterized protein (TIGR03435 family)